MAKTYFHPTSISIESSVDTTQIYDFNGTWTMPSGKQLSGSIFLEYADSTNGDRRLNMRGLFEVWVVDPEEGRIVDCTEVIADNEISAQLKALADVTLVKDLDDYDVIIRRVGNVRAKREVQEVRVVEGKSGL